MDTNHQRVRRSRNRPAPVWVISIFYLFSIGFTLLAFLLTHSGLIPMNAAQAAYYDSLTIIDYAFTILTSSLNLTGAILLFLLRKQAFFFFATAFAMGLVLTVYHALTKQWLEAINAYGFLGLTIGWGINIAIILYSKRLVSRGISK